jgi:integrase
MSNNLSLEEAIRSYLDDLGINRRSTTVNRAQQILNEFIAVAGDVPLSEIGRAHINRFLASRREADNCNRTLWNKSTRVLALLRHHGITLKCDKPRYVESIPQVYDKDELARFFSACDERQLCYFKTLLMTGIRMQESKWLRWDDVKDGLLHVRAHPPDFVPKTHEERRIPLPSGLVELLRVMPRRPGELVFPTKSGSPDRHLLRHCKRVAARAGLDPAKWSLHGFRRTFCTSLLRSGLDARSVMQLMGHSDIESTLRYWRPLEVESLREKSQLRFRLAPSGSAVSIFRGPRKQEAKHRPLGGLPATFGSRFVEGHRDRDLNQQECNVSLSCHPHG